MVILRVGATEVFYYMAGRLVNGLLRTVPFFAPRETIRLIPDAVKIPTFQTTDLTLHWSLTGGD